MAVYLVTIAVFFAFAAPERLTKHTPYNHFALLAESWLEGRLDLGGAPPGYAGMNDFARFDGRWYVTFPPFPAVLLLPLVKLGGRATRVQDGQFFIWLAGVAPAVLFLAFEKLRRLSLSPRSTRANAVLALLFAFGSVYFFSAEQGTVWFAAHVVGAGLAALYLLFAIDAERPLLAGLMIGFGFMTRSPLLFAVPLFAFEAARVSLRELEGDAPRSPKEQLVSFWRRLHKGKVLKLYAAFSVPILVVIAFALWHNDARFGNPFDFGYEHLTVRWAERMKKWGLFHYHYLGRNLGVMLASLPYWVKNGPVPFQINAHGLALWVTTPLYFWLIWPKHRGPLHLPLWLTVIAVGIWTCLYQNTGWVQFGWRFSNDYAVFLFALLAIGGRRMGPLFAAAAIWSVGINGFGALSFDRAAYGKYYFRDPSQRVIFQPD